MESLDMKRAVICIFLMALVTYVPRVLPLTVFRKQIRSRYIRSFLDYTPYAVLGAMTFRMCSHPQEILFRPWQERRRRLC